MTLTYPRSELEDDQGWLDLMQTQYDSIRTMWAVYGPIWSEGLFGIEPEGIPDEETGEVRPRPSVAEVDARIVNMFTAFCSGRYEPTKAAHDDLGDAVDTVDDPVHGGLVSLHTYISGNWHGRAANDFADRCGDLERACDNMNEILTGAHLAMDAYQDMLLHFRDHICYLIEDTQGRLEWNETVDEQRDLNLIQTVVAAGQAAATGGSLIGALEGAAHALTQGNLTDQILKLGGEGEGDIIYSMVTEGEKIIEDAREAARRVHNSFMELRPYVTPGGSEYDRVRPDRPELITDDRFDPNDFYNIEQPEEAYDEVSREELVEEPSGKEARSTQAG